MHRQFERAASRAGNAVTLHALRHTAAYRMAEDPALPLTDVQLVLGHARLSTRQVYLTPRTEDVIRRVLARHAGQARAVAGQQAAPPAPGYQPETLGVLFGRTGCERPRQDRPVLSGEGPAATGNAVPHATTDPRTSRSRSWIDLSCGGAASLTPQSGCNHPSLASC